MAEKKQKKETIEKQPKGAKNVAKTAAVEKELRPDLLIRIKRKLFLGFKKNSIIKV